MERRKMKMEGEATAQRPSPLYKPERELLSLWAQYRGREASRGIGTKVYMEEVFKH
jgi:hypothetical protein